MAASLEVLRSHLEPAPAEDGLGLRGTRSAPLAKLVPGGRILELSGEGGCARSSAAVSLVAHTQASGGFAAWVQLAGGALYPPDLAAAGVDLEALVVVHVPSRARGGLPRAAELLLRSGAFELVVLDGSGVGGAGWAARWQGRLAGLLRQHDARLVLLTTSCADAPSAGAMVGMRIETRRVRDAAGQFVLRHHVLKDKVGLTAEPAVDLRRGPDGL